MTAVPTKFLLFSDMHIRKTANPAKGGDMAVRFGAGLDLALSRHPDAARLILPGDLANTGKVAEYERLRTALAGCPLPVTFMVGNHDNRDSLQQVFPDLPRPDGFVQSILDLPHSRLLFLDTLDGPPYRSYHHAGVLCDDRLAWLDLALKTAGARRCIVFMHHPSFAVGMQADTIRLENDTAFLDLLAQYPKVAHIVTGHVHRVISGNIGNIGYSVLGSIAPPFALLPQDDPDPGGFRAAYGVLEVAPDGITLHTEYFTLETDGDKTRARLSL